MILETFALPCPERENKLPRESRELPILRSMQTEAMGLAYCVFRVHVVSHWHPKTPKEMGRMSQSWQVPLRWEWQSWGASLPPCLAPRRIPGPGPTMSGPPKSKQPVTTALCPIPLRKVELVGIRGVNLQNSRALGLPRLCPFWEAVGREHVS